jgi:hypothetical protein
VQVAQHVVQPARGQDAVAGQHLQVAGARVLRQVTHLAGDGDRARGGRTLTRENPGQGGLTGAVTADEPDLVTGVDPERGVLYQQSGAGAQFDVRSYDHGWRTLPDWKYTGSLH